MWETARSKKSAEHSERAADRTVDRRVGAKPKTTANAPKSRERTSKRDVDVRSDHQNNECALPFQLKAISKISKTNRPAISHLRTRVPEL